jgi:single-stranded-DNA-specific exonuclease
MWQGLPQNSMETTPLFHRFGGHAHAVGFSLPSGSLPLLRARMRAYSATRLTPSLLIPQLNYDAELSLADLTPEFNAWIARCAPFGIGNPEPIFLTRSATLASPVRLIQQKHVCLQLTQFPAQPSQASAPAIPGVGWSRGLVNWPALCTGLTVGSAIDILYRIRHNTGPYAGPHFGGLELELCALRSATL